MRRRVKFVYYLRNAQGHIKIGCTEDVQRRFKHHLAFYGLDIDFVAKERGGVTLERERHRQFAQWRLNQTPKNRSEWFLPNEALSALIASLDSSMS